MTTSSVATTDYRYRTPRADDGVSWASVTAGAVFILLGGAWLLDAANLVELRAAVVLPLLVALVGLVLIGVSFFGDHPGLIVLGTLLTVATVFSALVPSESIRGGMGERQYAPISSIDLKPDYELAVGDMTLDLSELTLSGRRQVDVVVGAGNLDVTLPKDVPVFVTAVAGAGEVEMLGDRVDGVTVEQDYRSEDYQDAADRLELNIEVGAGSIEVTK